jgi:hypothetical protein
MYLGFTKVVLDLTAPPWDIRTHSLQYIAHEFEFYYTHPLSDRYNCSHAATSMGWNYPHLNIWIAISSRATHIHHHRQRSRGDRAFYTDFSMGWIMTQLVYINTGFRPVVSSHSSVCIFNHQIDTENDISTVSHENICIFVLGLVFTVSGY